MKKQLKNIQILLIEDNRLLRDGISAMLKKQQYMNIIATVGNDENNSKLIIKLESDIILIDLGLRNRNRLQSVKNI